MTVVFGMVLVAAGVAAVTDARSGRIPNALTLPLLAVSPLAQWYSAGEFGLVVALAGILVCGTVPLFLFCRGAMGGGDVKLLAAIGGGLGPALGLEVQMGAYVLAALYAAAVLFGRGGLALGLRLAALLLVRAKASASVTDERTTQTVRLGIFIFLACALSVGRVGFGSS